MSELMGWSPIDKDGELLREVAGYTPNPNQDKLEFHIKMLPNGAVMKTLAKRIEDIEIREDRKVSREEMVELRDRTVFEMLPNAFKLSGFVLAYMNVKTGVRLKNNNLNFDEVKEHLDVGGSVVKIDIYFSEKRLENDGASDNETGQISLDLVLFAGIFFFCNSAVNYLFGCKLS